MLRLENASLAGLLERLKPKKIVTFSDRGERKLMNEVFSGLSKEEDVCVIVGGFPHGDFLSDVEKLSDELVSIDPELLCAPTVMMRVIFAYEDTYGVPKTRLARLSNAL